MNAFGSLHADEIHVERFWLRRAGSMISWSTRDLVCESPQNDVAKSTNRWCTNLNQSFAEQPANRIFNFDETSWKCPLGLEK
jgi:hypothetical protein